MTAPRCPRCESREATPIDVELFGYEEKVRATHECAVCHCRFRFVPPPKETSPCA